MSLTTAIAEQTRRGVNEKACIHQELLFPERLLPKFRLRHNAGAAAPIIELSRDSTAAVAHLCECSLLTTGRRDVFQFFHSLFQWNGGRLFIPVFSGLRSRLRWCHAADDHSAGCGDFGVRCSARRDLLHGQIRLQLQVSMQARQVVVEVRHLATATAAGYRWRWWRNFVVVGGGYVFFTWRRQIKGFVWRRISRDHCFCPGLPICVFALKVDFVWKLLTGELWEWCLGR